jgi:hypothetical protein
MGGNSSKNGGTGASSAGSGANSETGIEAGTETTVDSAGSAVGSSPGAVGMESVGVVGPEQLIAETEAAAAGIPNVDPATGQLGELNPNGQWSALTPPAVEVICAVVLPAWQIQTAEQRPVSEALAECLEQVFPGGIEGRYACWVRLIFACGAITVSRVAQNGGKLPPLFLPKSNPPPTPPAHTNGAAGPPRDPMSVTSLTE